MATSPVPPQRVASATQNPTQMAWMQQQGSPSAHQFASPRQLPPGSHLMPNGNSHQPNLQMSTPQLPPQILGTPQNQHMRTVTPLQALNNGATQGAQQPQSAMANAFTNAGIPQGGQPAQATQASQGQQVHQQQSQPQQQQPPAPGFAFRPMSQEAFQTVYQGWLAKNPKDTSLLLFENRPIDLYKLHCEVINAGGVTRVCHPIHPYVKSMATDLS